MLDDCSTLLDDSPLLAAAAEPAQPLAASAGLAPIALDAADAPLPVVGGARDAPAEAVAPEELRLVFDAAGSLGIEFERLAAPYVVQEIHAGLATGRGLERGHKLISVGGQEVDGLSWEQLVPLLQNRPVTAVFRRDSTEQAAAEGVGTSLLSGFAGLSSWGASVTQNVAQHSRGLASSVGSVTSSGLQSVGKQGLVAAGAGLDLGSKGLGLSTKVTSSLYSGLLNTVQDRSGADGAPVSPSGAEGLAAALSGDVPLEAPAEQAPPPAATFQPPPRAGADDLDDVFGPNSDEADFFSGLKAEAPRPDEVVPVPTARPDEVAPQGPTVASDDADFWDGLGAEVAPGAPAAVQAAATVSSGPPAEAPLDAPRPDEPQAPSALLAPSDDTDFWEGLGADAPPGPDEVAPSAQVAPRPDEVAPAAQVAPQGAGAFLAPDADAAAPDIPLQASAEVVAEAVAPPEAMLATREAAAEATAAAASIGVAWPEEAASDVAAAAASAEATRPEAEVAREPPYPVPAAEAPPSVSAGGGTSATEEPAPSQVFDLTLADSPLQKATPAAAEFLEDIDLDEGAPLGAADGWVDVGRPEARPEAPGEPEVPAHANGGPPPAQAEESNGGEQTWGAKRRVERMATPVAAADAARSVLQAWSTGGNHGLAGLGQEALGAEALAAVAIAEGEKERLAARVRDLEGALQEAAAAKQIAEQNLVRLEAEVSGSGDASARLAAELQAVQEQCAQLSADLQNKDAEMSRLQAAAKSASDASEKGFSERLARLAKDHEEEMQRAKEAWESKRQFEALASEKALDAERRLRSEEAARAQREMEQLRFALAERDKQLAEKIAVIEAKEDEVGQLLQQLSSAPIASEPAASGEASPASSAAKAAPKASTFEVMFAIEGSLGIEFVVQKAPYVVLKVHDGGVACGLGILPGDELVSVAGQPVDQAPWETLAGLIRARPVVARFSRDPARLEKLQEQEGGPLKAASFVAAVARSAAAVGAAAAVRVGQAEPAANAAEAAALSERAQAEIARLQTLVRARDAVIADLRGKITQKDEALSLLQGGSVDAADASRLVQERVELVQRLQETQAQLEEARSRSEALQGECGQLREQCAEEGRKKEEANQHVLALTDRCDSLMKQFDSLNQTCSNLSLDSKQKVALEAEVRQLAQVNAQWQEAHRSLNAQSEDLRQRASEVQQLQAQVAELRTFEAGYLQMEQRVRECEQSLQQSLEDAARLQQERQADQATIARLQGEIDSVQETGDWEAGHLEGELLERSRECAALRRQVEEHQSRVQELLRHQSEGREAIDDVRALRKENTDLRQDLEASQAEQKKLSEVVERCLQKMEGDSRDRPHLVDKRMVTQMVAAFLEQRDHPRHAQEILSRMADLLGFTEAERQQVGLSQRRRTLLEQQEQATGLSDLTDRFMDFLLEETEGG